MQNLETSRHHIDQIDRELVVLLEKRLHEVKQVIAYKKAHDLPVLDSDREQAVLDKVASFVSKPEYKETITNTFADMMARSREYQAKQ
ncbi:chorismate mutase [Streptococcus merionis]|uniref:chorismate mutase n=1 Tax=Streptococcus merionis TaxID=400065 RepID=UPI0026ED06DE|nr:chorismate mutase [Streptococcus merionis]